jgi:hypothetical protein
VHVKAVGGGAGLADVAHLGEHRPVDGRVEVGVGEDEEGGVAAQLHGDAENLLGGLFDELATDLGGAGEGQLACPGILEERFDEGAGAPAGDDVENAAGQTGLLEDMGEGEHGKGRLLGGLDDDRAAGGDRGGDLPGAHRGGEVPGGDEDARPDGLAHGEDPSLAGRVDHVSAVYADGLLGEPAEELGGVGDLGA